MRIGRLRINNISLFILSTLLALFVVYTFALISLFKNSGLILLPFKTLMVTAAFVLSFQGIFTLFWMLYAWEDPEKMAADTAPKLLYPAKKSFSLLIPARFESEVISNTLKSFAKLEYPDHLFEVIVLCKSDDAVTIQRARTAIKESGKKNFSVHVFEAEESSKPSALNIGLSIAKHDIVGVFDAEDEPSVQILDVVNTVFLTKKPAVVQGGVQLMNYRTRWFSPLNVLEYYFWYKSALHLFSRMNVVPLGGNTVFFNKAMLVAAGGWQECLTEDAEIGLRLSAQNQKIQVVYHPLIATAEESPASVTALLKQRTRWNQGFFQILLQKKWSDFADLKRRAFAFYFLILAQINAFNFILVFFSLATFFIELPVFATLVVMFPLYLLLLQLLTQLLGYYEFCKDFKKGFSILVCLQIVFCFLPYQFVLSLGALRALSRHFQKKENWEKTDHQNLHRLATI